MMSQAKINDLFGDHRFKNARVETVFASTTESGGVRLIVVVIPMSEITMYRVEKSGEVMLITMDFKSALKTFRRLI